MDSIVREMTKTDWENVKNIYIQALTEGLSTFQTECPSYDEWDRNHIKDLRLVASVNGTTVGFCVLSETSKRKAYRGVVEVSIYIDKKYRNMGIGTQLLNKMCSMSEKYGYWSLFSNIISNNMASIKLHKKCGFREIGYREKIAKDRFGNWQDTIMFEYRNSIR
jgi:L-amino acid N-acyltransferase YncA